MATHATSQGLLVIYYFWEPGLCSANNAGPGADPACTGVTTDVTEPDVSIAEEDHDAISIAASWEGGLQKQPLPPLTIPWTSGIAAVLSPRTQGVSAGSLNAPLLYSGMGENEMLASSVLASLSGRANGL
ncbi:UNVERIFIED_CONTAM: hypothetical protein FKN15_006956 [Acipenser sinensis]